MAKPFLFALLLLSFVGCSKPTEEQRLSQFRNSYKYKGCRMLSEKAVKLSVEQYNKQAKDPVDKLLAHSILGILCLTSGQSEYCFIEADVIGEAPAEDAKTLSLALKSIALFKMEYPELSKAHYEDLKKLQAARQNKDANAIETEHKLFLVALIVVGLQQSDAEQAKFGADALGAISQLDYLPPLVGAVAEAKMGHPLKAVEQLRELNKSDRFSEHKKVLIAETMDIIANASDKSKLGDELVNRVLVQIVKRVLDDIFTAENRAALLEKTKTLPNLLSGKKVEELPSVDNPTNGKEEPISAEK